MMPTPDDNGIAVHDFDRRNFLKGLGLSALAGGSALTLSNFAEAGQEKMAAAREQKTAGAYELPPLPYAYDALEPVLTKEILVLHHDKHHAAYVKGLNDALDKLAKARAEGDFASVTALSRDLAFHGSGHILHTLYWNSMKPGAPGKPGGSLAEAIDRDFGSFDQFKGQFIAATKQVEASGWGVLGYEPMERRLLVLQAEKHQNLTFWGIVPLMVCDVWEHAYYLKYENRRPDYVDAFFKIIDWDSTAKRFELAAG